MSKAPLSTASRYGVALLSVTLALIVRLLLHPFLDTDAPLLLFTLSVMVSAWYGGYGPGVFSTLLGAVIGSHLFLEPIYSLQNRKHKRQGSSSFVRADRGGREKCR